MKPALAELRRRAALALLRAPSPLLRAIAGPTHAPEGGAGLDRQVQALIRLSEWIRQPRWHELGVARGRRLMDASALLLAARPQGVVRTTERHVPVADGRIPVRIYTPAEPGVPGPLPVVVYYHGGGYVFGSLASHDGECRTLALGAKAIVVAVDYRLAPEHRFPTAVDDGLAAFRWVAENAASFGGDPSRVAVAGDSAGGNLSAVISRETRGEALRPIFQLLIYPVVDFTRSYPSHRLFAAGYLLDTETIDWFLAQYLGGKPDEKHPRVSPLLAGDHGGLPPAMIMTAGFDPLRDEGAAYAEALRAAGVVVEHRCYDGLVHGFFSMSGGVDAARGAIDDATAALRRAFGGGGARS